VTKIISLTVINLIAPKAGVKHRLFSTNQPQFTEHLSDLSGAKSVTRIIAISVMNSVIPKSAAKYDLLFNRVGQA
jgi:hypothetical protein